MYSISINSDSQYLGFAHLKLALAGEDTKTYINTAQAGVMSPSKAAAAAAKFNCIMWLYPNLNMALSIPLPHWCPSKLLQPLP